MTFYEAAIEVLRRSGRPLHYKKITEFAIRDNLLSHIGKTPDVTMSARLNREVKREDLSWLVKMRPGVFTLRDEVAERLNEEAKERDEAAAKQREEEAEKKSAKQREYPEDPELFDDNSSRDAESKSDDDDVIKIYIHDRHPIAGHSESSVAEVLPVALHKLHRENRVMVVVHRI